MQRASRRRRRGRIAHVRARDAPLQVVEKIDGRVGTGVGLEQRDLEVFVERRRRSRAPMKAPAIAPPVRCSPVLSLAIQPERSAPLLVGSPETTSAAPCARATATASGCGGVGRGGRCGGRSTGFLPKNSSPTSAFSQSRALRGGCAPAASPVPVGAASPPPEAGRSGAGAAAGGGLLRKKLNMRNRLGEGGGMRAPNGAARSKRRLRIASRWLAILAASGALAQSVRATES